jgi:hypothetical protein
MPVWASGISCLWRDARFTLKTAMSNSDPYNDEFFAVHRDGSLASARQVVPVIMQMTGCRSVVDLGCGQGSWLAAFHEQGLKDLCGFDGEYVNKEQLLIPREMFVTADLSQPLKVNRRFDLAMSLEVIEHLPPAMSDSFIDLLTSLSPVVLFSGALPHQEGTCHVNERWMEDWVEMFRRRGYRAVDCLRSRFWSDTKVAWWYAQNMVLYVSEKHIADYPEIEKLLTTAPPVTWVHPQLLIHKENRLGQQPLLTQLWRTALTRTWKAFTSRLAGRGRPPA